MIKIRTSSIESFEARKHAFTLIELLITIAIIGMVTVLGVPAFSKYGEQARFDQKVSEIKYGLEETHLSMLNPQNGISEYRFVPSGGELVLQKSPPPKDYKKIILSAKEAILPASGGTAEIMICEVATKACTEGELFKLYSSSTDRTVIFTVHSDPFGVEVSE